MNAYRLVTLIVVSVLVAILLASALNGFTRVSDSALAETAPIVGAQYIAPVQNAPNAALKNYLPIIFLNSATAGGAWLLSGNAGTVDGVNFLGTTDNVTLTLRVSNTVALRIAPTLDAPNIIAGHSLNSVTNGVIAATIGGGGGGAFACGVPCPNRVTDSFGTVGGGQENVAGNNSGSTFDAAYSTVGGGSNNSASGSDSTIGGGNGNSAGGAFSNVGGGNGNFAGGAFSNVGGGESNTASGNGAAIGGGGSNNASGYYATVPGGVDNSATMSYTFAAGNLAQAIHQGAFVWSDSTGTPFASSAKDQFLIRAQGGVGIGTNSPDTQLHVVKSANGTGTNPVDNVVVFENTNTGSSADVLALKIASIVTPTQANNFITFLNGNNASVGAIQGNNAGSVELAGAGNDYAEYLPRANANEALSPGDIVGVFNGRITKATHSATQVMVMSTGPLVAGNDPGESKRAGFALVVFIGQVQVRVRGVVRAGDFIIPSGDDDGIGIAVSPETIMSEQFAQVVGEAWESSSDANVKVVNVAVGLIRNDPTVARLVAHNQNLDARISALEQATGQAPNALPISNDAIFVGALVVVGFVVIGRRKRA